MTSVADAVVPGQRLGHVQEYIAGAGTYALQDFLYASVVGLKQISRTSDNELPTMTVQRENSQSAIPEIEAIVTCKVVRVNPRFASVNIMVVDGKPCKDDFQGIIRVQDVRATEKDKVKIYNSFRPGDIVRAQVISLGDARSYYLSTAANELGVIFGTSVAGGSLVPISWQEMQCTKTKVIELRKCAKPMQ
ncbi:Exosome complex component CSL4 [Mortierella alpina]|uniref:Exosome complex component CSL4 n=1 Tax=Mortierella alpina TaxID=64518 RepID=A0A9P6LXQ3_MORAP|nr:Exosome complex component CSL4 [Mortierella alpina]KAF9949232.1 Exosome complex component CSL4 [Mortierella alpina]